MRSRFSTACLLLLSLHLLHTNRGRCSLRRVSRAQRPQNPSASVGARFGSSFAGPPPGFSRPAENTVGA
ncbi:hypothetical protein EJB05_17789, partial [Eragrostis curvula]